MTTQIRFLAAMLPIAAIGLLGVEATGGNGYEGELYVSAEAKTLDAAPRSRGAIRGARPTPERPADAEKATVNDTVRYAGQPRRQDSRSLPQTGNGFVLLADEPRSISPRGARD